MQRERKCSNARDQPLGPTSRVAQYRGKGEKGGREGEEGGREGRKGREGGKGGR